ncbi:MAG: S53 family peptidase [Gemmatimonadetes bacterium]|nr:S53 family peptidase [Gemmatimonadota bacterium]
MRVSLVLHPVAPDERHRQHHVIARFAAHHGLQLSFHGDHVRVEGPEGRLCRAFGITRVAHEHPHGGFRRHHTHLVMPTHLHGAVAHVVGFDESRASVSRLHHLREARSHHAAPRARGGTAPIPVARLLEHYNFPADLDGTGQRIAIISLGGGFHESDLDGFFKRAGLRRPDIRAIPVDGGKNAPLPMARLKRVMAAYNTPSISLGQLWRDFPKDLSAAISTVEATMDVEIAAAAAPGARIEVYCAENSPQGLYHAIRAAISGSDGTPPAVISLSWGWPEEQLSGESASAINQAMELAWNAGVCVCCASGDSGSVGLADDDIASDAASVLFPASSPWVLACGGTEVEVHGATFRRETAWNAVGRGVQQATGGGVSGAFRAPAWQQGAAVPSRATLNGAAWIAPSVPPETRAAFVGRGVPDVAAYAAQDPGYLLHVGGTDCGAGGTSAATPLWAGLVARLAQEVGGKVRLLPRLVYAPTFADAFRSIESGDNAIRGATSAASFAAAPGWSACCGVGAPDGQRLRERLVQALAAPHG